MKLTKNRFFVIVIFFLRIIIIFHLNTIAENLYDIEHVNFQIHFESFSSSVRWMDQYACRRRRRYICVNFKSETVFKRKGKSEPTNAVWHSKIQIDDKWTKEALGVINPQIRCFFAADYSKFLALT